MLNIPTIKIDGDNIKKNILGFYEVTEDEHTIKYPVDYRYKSFFFVGTAVFVLGLLNLGLQKELFWGVRPGIFGFAGLLGLLMEMAIRKDLSRKKPDVKLPQYISYKDSTATEPDQIDLLKFYTIFSVTALAVLLLSSMWREVPTTGGQTTYDKKEFITQTVKEAKTALKLPQQVDSATTLVDVTAQKSAIRYQYVVEDVAPDQLSNKFLKNNLLSSVCETPAILEVLKEDINMEYEYKLTDSNKEFLITITEKDCN